MEPAFYIRPAAPYSPPRRKKSPTKSFCVGITLFSIAAIAVGGCLIYYELTRPLPEIIDHGSITKLSMGTAEKWSNQNNQTEEKPVQSVDGKSMPLNQSELSSSTESTTSSSSPPVIHNQTKIPHRMYNEEELFASCPANSTAPELPLSGKSDNVSRFMKTTRSHDYKWVKYDPKSFNRSKAYKVGASFEGHEIYLGRGIVCGDLVPANVDHDNNQAIVTYHNATFFITDFEVFIFTGMDRGKLISKKRGSGKDSPANAIPIGITKTGQKLFSCQPAGRRENSSDFPIGKVHPADHVCHYPTASLGEHDTSEYQIFVIEGGTFQEIGNFLCRYFIPYCNVLIKQINSRLSN